MKKLIIILQLILTANLLTGQIINIPSDYPTIQQGINSANNGDTVLVDTGTYVENLNFNGKNITVASYFLTTLDTAFISQTLIDGNNSGSVVTFENSEDSTSILCGFSITNGGDVWFGGGIFCHYSSPTIVNLIISNNSAIQFGGGIYCYYSNSNIKYSTIKNNEAWAFDTGESGGGIYCEYSDPKLYHLTISNNSSVFGGGISCNYSDPYIVGTFISENEAKDGGGIYLNHSEPTIQDGVMVNNYADYKGGGISCQGYSDPILHDVEIINNEADRGGGMNCYLNSDPSLINVRIINNTALLQGGGFYCTENSSLVFDNENRCNIYLNSSLEGNDIYSESIIDVIADTFSVINPTDYHLAPIYNYSYDILNEKLNQIDADLFVSPDGSNENSGLSANDPLRNIQYAFSVQRVDSTHKNIIKLLEGVYSQSTNGETFPIDLPDYYSLIGVSSPETIIDAESVDKVFRIFDNSYNFISDFTITGGSGGSNQGGGIQCWNSNPTLQNLKITDNSASQGAGIWITQSNSKLSNVVLINNSAGQYGGGILSSNSNLLFYNTTLSNNSAQDHGGAINCSSNSNILLLNTIIWDNSPNEVYFNANGEPNSLDVSWSNIHGGENGIITNGNGTVNWLEGNIDDDPLFVGSGANPFELSIGSPCIDTGITDTSGLNLPNTDIVLNKRIWDGDNNGTAIIDMGAYEFGSIPVGVYQFEVRNLKFNFNCYPNPFSDFLIIEYSLHLSGLVSLTINDVNGTKLKTIFSKFKQKGNHSYQWNTGGLKKGVYFCKLKTNNGIQTRKIIKL